MDKAKGVWDPKEYTPNKAKRRPDGTPPSPIGKFGKPENKGDSNHD